MAVDPKNPYGAPLTSGEKSSQLGSLSQSARTGQLKQARVILIVVGVLTIAFNLFFLLGAEAQVNRALDGEVRKLQGQGMMIDQQKLQEIRENAVRLTQIVSGATVLLGFVFVVLGIVVYSIPVPATVLGLVLYVGAVAIFGVLEPTTLAHGWLFKILIIVGLFKSVQAALAYQREKQAAEAAAFGTTI
jgi:hypothetical protein